MEWLTSLVKMVHLICTITDEHTQLDIYTYRSDSYSWSCNLMAFYLLLESLKKDKHR